MKLLIWHGSPSVVLLSDLFTGVNGTSLTAHTMNRGGGWTVLEGSYDIQGNAAHGNTAVTMNRAVADAGNKDCTVTAAGLSVTSTTRLGLLARYLNAANGYEGYWDTNLGNINIYENNFGTQRATAPLAYVAGKTWNLRLQVSGTTITFTVTQADNPANSAIISYGSMAVNLTNTKFGMIMYSNEAGSSVDNFQVTNP